MAREASFLTLISGIDVEKLVQKTADMQFLQF